MLTLLDALGEGEFDAALGGGRRGGPRPGRAGRIVQALVLTLRLHLRLHGRDDLVRIDVDTGAFNSDGGAWLWDPTWDFSGDVWQSGPFVELRLPWADLGYAAFPATVRVHMSMVSVSGNWTYAGVPSTSFTDGPDPDYMTYYEFTVGGSAPPNAHIPMP